jgi:uncharacterized protein (TIGR00730 family)
MDQFAGKTSDERLLATPTSEEASFIHSDPWRVLRIQSEFVRGLDALADLGPAVTLFGSARTRVGDPDYAAAVDTARLLGKKGYAIVTGGGPGIMQAANEGAKLAAVKSIGLNIELPFEQHLNPYCDVSVDFRYFFVRKVMLVKVASAFVIFPGGYGTLDELMEALTLVQTGKISNFPIILYGSAYWTGLVKWLKDTVLPDGKISASDIDLLRIVDTPEEVVHIVTATTKTGKDHDHQLDIERASLAEAAKAYAPPPFALQ